MTPQEINEMRMMLGEDKEQWAPVAGHEGYEVSTHGQVRSYWGGGWGKWRIRDTPQRLVSVWKASNHFMVSLGRGKQELIHRLVASTFIPNPDNLPYVDHIDRNTSNNNINNLRWCNRAQNNFNSKNRHDNTSGKRGVTKHRWGWTAWWQEQGKRKTKTFKTYEEAAAHRDKMVQEHYDPEFYQEA